MLEQKLLMIRKVLLLSDMLKREPQADMAFQRVSRLIQATVPCHITPSLVRYCHVWNQQEMVFAERVVLESENS